MKPGDDGQADRRAGLLQAALPHVAFDGWSAATLAAAARECGLSDTHAAVLCPSGALDLACDYHRDGDRRMAEALAAEDLSGLRYSARVARALEVRLAASDREVVRRGAALFALPQNAATGAALVWGTADAVWRALGDRSDDVNWYSKRAILAAVWSATVLYWLGDASGGADTRAFIERRIAGVMRFEKAKADFRKSPAGRALAGPLSVLDRIRAPKAAADDLPGRAR